MKLIRFTLHYLGRTLYKLGQALWAPALVAALWFTTGYLLSRLTVVREMFDKDYPDWFMVLLSPMIIVTVITTMVFIITVAVLLSVVIWHIFLDVRHLHPITRIKNAYNSFK